MVSAVCLFAKFLVSSVWEVRILMEIGKSIIWLTCGETQNQPFIIFFWNYNHWSETDKKLALKLHFSYSRVQLGTESCYNLQHRKNTLLHKLRTKANIHCFVSFGFIYRNKAWSGNIFSLHCLQPIHRNGMHQIINVVLICYWVPHFPLLSVPLWFLRSCLLSFQ